MLLELSRYLVACLDAILPTLLGALIMNLLQIWVILVSSQL